jgi:hypothetical protein
LIFGSFKHTATRACTTIPFQDDKLIQKKKSSETELVGFLKKEKRREKKMKKTVFVMLIGAFILGTVAAAGAEPVIGREARQQARIQQGVQSGEITPLEYQRLEREQAAIEAHRQKAWADGTLSPWEAQHLTREQNRASRHIWRTKHN